MQTLLVFVSLGFSFGKLMSSFEAWVDMSDNYETQWARLSRKISCKWVRPHGDSMSERLRSSVPEARHAVWLAVACCGLLWLAAACRAVLDTKRLLLTPPSHNFFPDGRCSPMAADICTSHSWSCGSCQKPKTQSALRAAA